MADLSPRAELIYALKNQTICWWRALAELIDNSLDAGATRVEIVAKNRRLIVKDNGHGIANLLSAVTLGHHDRQETTKLGRFGIGLKDAWLFCADRMEIRTVHKGRLGVLTVDTDSLIRNNWQSDDPTYSETTEPSGTTITLPLREGRNLPNPDVFEDLAFVFSPAITNGFKLVKDTGKPVVLTAHVMPVLLDAVEAAFEVDGKSVAIHIGILPENAKLSRGPFWMQFEHRIIDRNSLGCGQYSAQRVAGRIVLGKEWDLAKNKDCIVLHKEALADAIFSHIEPVLKKASELSESMEAAALRTALESQLNTVIQTLVVENQRPSRAKGSKQGTIVAKGTGRKVYRASKTSGKLGTATCVITKVGRRSGFAVDWCETDHRRIGWFDQSGLRVSLNTRHSFIAECKDSQNQQALLSCAAALIADNACRSDLSGHGLFHFSFHDFSSALGGLISSTKEADTNG